MRNWHTKIIKLDEAKAYMALNGFDENGNSNISVGVIEGSIEYIPIDNSEPIHMGNNYTSPHDHLRNTIGDKKIIYRQRYDDATYDDNVPVGNDFLTHTTSVVGVVAGNQLTGNRSDNVFGICPNAKIINSEGFENSLILAGINQYSRGNSESFFYNNEAIVKKNGEKIDGSNYFSLKDKTIPIRPLDSTNIYSKRKSDVISCSFSWSNNPLSGTPPVTTNMPAEITDFVLKELFAYGRDGRGVLTVFAAGNETTKNPTRPYTLSNKTLIVGASKVTLDEEKLDLYISPINPLSFNEARASYSNSGDRIDLCAPSCPTGSGKSSSTMNELEIYSTTMLNSGEIGENDQLFTSLILKKTNNKKLILTDFCEGIFPGQSIEIGDPNSFKHEVRFITDVKTVPNPVNNSPLKSNLTEVTLDQNIVFTEPLFQNNGDPIQNTEIPVKICVLKKAAIFLNLNQLRIDNMNGIGKNQSPNQKAYLYSGTDILNGMSVTITNSDYTNNTIVIQQAITLSSTDDLKLIPGQIFTKLTRKAAKSTEFIATKDAQGFFSGQQVYINEEKISRHIQYVAGTGTSARVKFSQLSAGPEDQEEPTYSEYNIKSMAYGNLTNSFGGTSAAAPIVSGASALLLSVNPNLNAAEIKYILKKSADKITGESKYKLVTDKKDYNYGYTTNENFGSGRLNVRTAIQYAKDWHIPGSPNPLNPSELIRKPKMAIADKLTGLGIWVRDTTALPNEIRPLDEIDTSKSQKIYVKIKNDGDAESFKECDLRILVAFTDDDHPTFKFPNYWYNQTDVKLLSVKEIPIIPANGETTIEIEWKDIAKNWDEWNSLNSTKDKRKNAFILAHIAPFDGVSSEVITDSFEFNKQLGCKPILVKHSSVIDKIATIPGNNLNITVGPALVQKNFNLLVENVLTKDLEDSKFQIKAYTTLNNKTKAIETVFYQKTNNTWNLSGSPTDNWISFDQPIVSSGNRADYTNIKFPHTINVDNTKLEVKLELVNI